MFNGSRLMVARQRRSLSRKDLANKIGVESRSVSGFEAGEYTPSEDSVNRIARVLRFPVGYFFGDDLDIPPPNGVSFRSLSKMSAKQRDAAIAAGAIAFAFSDWVDQKISIPNPDLPDLRDDSPEVAALALRQHWGLGELPVKNMVHLLEAKGVRVFSLTENCVEIDAYSLWRGPKPYVFLNSQKSTERRRFDAAHELGHLVLHKHAAPNGISAEKDANMFAGAFLMPGASMKALGIRSPSIDDILRIKKKWSVAAFALPVRLHQLGLISDWHYTSLCIEMQRRGYREMEPRGIRMEVSQVWPKALKLLRDIGLGVQDIATTLHLPEDEIVALLFRLVTVGLPSTAQVATTKRGTPQLRVV